MFADTGWLRLQLSVSQLPLKLITVLPMLVAHGLTFWRRGTLLTLLAFRIIALAKL